jgi:hypothetical protein
MAVKENTATPRPVPAPWLPLLGLLLTLPCHAQTSIPDAGIGAYYAQDFKIDPTLPKCRCERQPDGSDHCFVVEKDTLCQLPGYGSEHHDETGDFIYVSPETSRCRLHRCKNDDYSALTDRSWHLLQKQVDGGVAAIIPGPTKSECEFARNRIKGLPATPEEAAARKAKYDDASAWIDAHDGCKKGLEMSYGESFMLDGVCHVNIPIPPVVSILSPHDVNDAECFQ